MLTFHERKEQRRIENQATYGLKLVTCGACSGSGYYDNTGSPACGWCGGSGKTRESREPLRLIEPPSWREKLAIENQRKSIGKERKKRLKNQNKRELLIKRLG